jgi:hypothetical protein
MEEGRNGCGAEKGRVERKTGLFQGNTAVGKRRIGTESV